MADKLRIEAAGATHAGLRRGTNEDSFVALAELGLIAVTDGVATRQKGEVASRKALDLITRALTDPLRTRPISTAGSPTSVRAQFIDAVCEANEVIHLDSLAVPRDQRMATTFAGALLADNILHVLHVGDSRVYLCRGGLLRTLTLDHTRANELLAHGVSEDQARSDPDAGALTRALGVSRSVLVTARSELVRVGDLVLVCTDGLHGVVPAPEIASILSSSELDLNTAARRLIERANAHGGPDNVTVVVARVSATSAKEADEPPEPTPPTLRARS
jgi:protein phosphatase